MGAKNFTGIRRVKRGGKLRLIIDFRYTDTNGERVRFRRAASVQAREAAVAEAQRLMKHAAETGRPEAAAGRQGVTPAQRPRRSASRSCTAVQERGTGTDGCRRYLDTVPPTTAVFPGAEGLQVPLLAQLEGPGFQADPGPSAFLRDQSPVRGGDRGVGAGRRGRDGAGASDS